MAPAKERAVDPRPAQQASGDERHEATDDEHDDGEVQQENRVGATLVHAPP
jgi:hypothetical protein